MVYKMYFKDFPSFYYDFKQNDGTTKSSIVKDITRNIRFRRDILANVTLYDRYDIRDGDTPEIIAEKVYGNAQYHWVIMLLNEKFDYISDYPLDEYSLVKYIDSVYSDVVINPASSVIPNVVLNMSANLSDASYTTEQLALKNYLLDKADLNNSGTITAFDARTWILQLAAAVRRSDVQLIIDQIVATENATPGIYPSGICIEGKYGIHHYEDAAGYVVNSDAPGATSVDNDTYMRRVNESKRTIKLVAPAVLNNILKNYKDLL